MRGQGRGCHQNPRRPRGRPGSSRALANQQFHREGAEEINTMTVSSSKLPSPHPHGKLESQGPGESVQGNLPGLRADGEGQGVHLERQRRPLAPALNIPLLLCEHLWLPRWGWGKEPTCQSRRLKRHRLDPWVWKIPWRRAWQPTPVFLPGESHGQRGLAGTVHGVTKSCIQPSD